MPAARRTHLRRDDGASVVELVLTMPALLLAILLIIQFALYQHARQVALAAAQEGAQAARAYDGTEHAAHARATAFLDTLGPRMLTDRSVTVTRTATAASVTVTARAPSLFDWVPLRIRETSAGEVERFVAPEGAVP